MLCATTHKPKALHEVISTAIKAPFLFLSAVLLLPRSNCSSWSLLHRVAIDTLKLSISLVLLILDTTNSLSDHLNCFNILASALIC